MCLPLHSLMDRPSLWRPCTTTKPARMETLVSGQETRLKSSRTVSGDMHCTACVCAPCVVCKSWVGLCGEAGGKHAYHLLSPTVRIYADRSVVCSPLALPSETSSSCSCCSVITGAWWALWLCLDESRLCHQSWQHTYVCLRCGPMAGGCNVRKYVYCIMSSHPYKARLCMHWYILYSEHIVLIGNTQLLCCVWVLHSVALLRVVQWTKTGTSEPSVDNQEFSPSHTWGNYEKVHSLPRGSTYFHSYFIRSPLPILCCLYSMWSKLILADCCSLGLAISFVSMFCR